MQNIDYYLDQYKRFALAHDKATDFFAGYVPQKGKWELSNVSFIQFRHDFPFNKVSQKEIEEFTSGVLPDELYNNFISVIKNNREGEKNSNMKELKYYLDEENQILSAYNRETDFFAQYFSKNGSWEMSKISFTEFKHSFNYKLINEEEASKISNGVLPNALFEQYVSIIESNRNAQEK